MSPTEPTPDFPESTPVVPYDSQMPTDVGRLLAWESITLPVLANVRRLVNAHTADGACGRLVPETSLPMCRLDPVFPRLKLVCPEKNKTGAWTASRDAPRFLDAAWERIQEARRFHGLKIRVMAVGISVTEDVIIRYPWDAVAIARPVDDSVMRAHAARWERNRWWP